MSFPSLHFQNLLKRRRLANPALTSFIEIKPTVVEFNEDDGVNTANFIDRLQVLYEENWEHFSENQGLFCVLRPKYGVEVFTKGMVHSPTKTNTNGVHCNSNNNTSNHALNTNAEIIDNLRSSVPQITKHLSIYIPYEIQRGSDWKIPYFTWNDKHLENLIKEANVKICGYPSLDVYQETEDPNIIRKVSIKVLLNNKSNGIEIKNAQGKFEEPPMKRMKINNNMIKEEMDDKSNPSNLKFFRGFCAISQENHSIPKICLKDYILQSSIRHAHEPTVYEECEIEDYPLIFAQWLNTGQSVKYAFIVNDEITDISTMNHPQSPFKPCELRKYGPFSALVEEDIYVDGFDDYVSEIYPGVQLPYIYFGNTHSFFCWHLEDLNFHSLNQLLFGADKVWFCIHPRDYNKVMLYFRKQFNYFAEDCMTPLQHKTIIMDPYILASLGINVYYIRQKPGDIVIAPPGGLHFGMNTGFNIAESVNFMDWSERQWKYSLSGMLVKSINFHDCMYDCLDCCGNKDGGCMNPIRRFNCECKACESMKCACDLHYYLDINILAQRCRNKYPLKAPSVDIVPLPFVDPNFSPNEKFKKYEINHLRKMSDVEIEERWTISPKGFLHNVYPVLEEEKAKRRYFPCILTNNHCYDGNQLLLTYKYEFYFIGYLPWNRRVDNAEVIWQGSMTDDQWNKPKGIMTHNYFCRLEKTIEQLKMKKSGKKKRQKSSIIVESVQTLMERKNAMLEEIRSNSEFITFEYRYDCEKNAQNVWQPRLRPKKPVPSFSWLLCSINPNSPLVGTNWENKAIEFGYRSGTRFWNKEKLKEMIRAKFVHENAIKQKRKQAIIQLSVCFHCVIGHVLFNVEYRNALYRHRVTVEDKKEKPFRMTFETVSFACSSSSDPDGEDTEEINYCRQLQQRKKNMNNMNIKSDVEYDECNCNGNNMKERKRKYDSGEEEWTPVSSKKSSVSAFLKTRNYIRNENGYEVGNGENEIGSDMESIHSAINNLSIKKRKKKKRKHKKKQHSHHRRHRKESKGRKVFKQQRSGMMKIGDEEGTDDDSQAVQYSNSNVNGSMHELMHTNGTAEDSDRAMVDGLTNDEAVQLLQHFVQHSSANSNDNNENLDLIARMFHLRD